MVQNNNVDEQLKLAEHGPAKIVYDMFRINLENLIKNKIYIAREYHIQPSEIDKIPFYEYEIYLEQMNLIAKKQEEENRKQQEEYEGMRSSMNPAKMMSGMKNGMSMPKMPTMSSPSMPKMPTISIPKI